MVLDVSVVLDKESIFSALGLSWHPLSDEFQFIVNTDKKNTVWTKRSVLSSVAQIYDPLGWLSPILITAKIFMQSYG